MTELEQMPSAEDVQAALAEGQTFREILRVEDSKMVNWTNEAEELIDKGKYEEASELLSVLTSLDPNVKDNWRLAAIAANERGFYDSALMAISFAIAIDEIDPMLHVISAKILHKKGDHEAYQGTVEILEEVISKRPDDIVEKLESEYGMSIGDLKHKLDSILY